MPLDRDYLEGMMSPPTVVPSIAGTKNVRVEEHAYREQQRVIGLSRAERSTIGDVQMLPSVAGITTPPSELAQKQTDANRAVHEGQKGNEAVDRVVVTPATVSLVVPATQQLTAVVYSVLGNIVERTVVWTSSDETKAVVDSAGLITSVAAGTPTITGTVEGKTDTCVVTATLT